MSNNSLETHSQMIKMNPRNIGIIIFGVIVFALMLKLLPYEPSQNGGLALLTLIAILWLTEAVHITLTALLIPILAVILKLTSVKESLSNFADPIIFLFFGGFAIATALHVQGLDKHIANKLIAIAKGNFLIAVIMLFLVTAFISMWISNTATTAMMIPLVLGILSKLDPKKEPKTFVFVLLGIAYSASIGGLGTIIGSPPNAIAAKKLDIDFYTWMLYGMPLVFTLLPACYAVLYFVFKPNLKHTFDISTEKFEWTRHRIITIVIFTLAVICWIGSTSVSQWLGGIKQFDTFVALSAAVLIGITGAAKWKDIQENTDWGVLMLFGGGLTLSFLLQESGASQILAAYVSGFVDNTSWFMIILIVTTFIIFLTEFTSNTASAALLIPIMAAIATELSLPIFPVVMIIGIGASCAFMLPVATPPNAIVYGTGFIKQKEMIKAGLYLNFTCIAIISSAAYFFW